ncbi:MAG: DUF6314 family protein [Pseudomonadota bacterium]
MLTASDFIGGWQLRRTIDDRYSRQSGQLLGGARFARKDDGKVTYHETGKVRFGDGPVMQTHRTYLWRFSDALVDVFFEDGSAFHSFAPQGTTAGTDHFCGDDLYQVAYDFTAWPTWKTVWSVKGPRKDYTMISAYSVMSAVDADQKRSSRLAPLDPFVVRPLSDPIGA